MKYQKIFPKDWVNMHPYTTTDDVDKYYTKVANRVAECIYKSGMHEADAMGEISPMAIYLTLWFEDIISETNVWKTVNTLCQQRYGYKLPFYNLEQYYDGEPNVQDVKLLIWLYIQVYNDDNFLMNPENIAIERMAEVVCDIFDECYENAPVNERLYDFYFNPELTDDYWACRHVVDWFTLHSYITVYAKERLFEVVSETLEEHSGILNENQIFYIRHMDLAYRQQNTLLSITPAEWVWYMRGAKEEEQNGLGSMRLSNNRNVEIVKKDDKFLWVSDCFSDELLPINLDSWSDESFISDLLKTKSKEGLVITTIPFKDKIYQCGFLVPRLLNEIHEEAQSKKATADFHKELYLKFNKLARGEFLIFYNSLDELKKTFKKLGMPSAEPPMDLLTPQGAICCSPVDGLFIVRNIELLKSPNNRFYDKEEANDGAIEFYVNPNMAPYEVTCAIHDAGWLPDARINSLKGEEYGRQFVQKYWQFLIDYFYSQHR